MKVMATVKERHDIDLLTKIGELRQSGIYDFRFNYAKVKSEVDEMTFCKTINQVTCKYSDVHVVVDIPYPGKKTRIICKNRKIHVQKGKMYTLHLRRISEDEIQENEIVIETKQKSDEFFLGQKLYYDMGECCFEVVELVDEYIIKVQALNSYNIYSNKGITTGLIKKTEYYDVVDRIHKHLKGVNTYALSFVESKRDLEDARRLKCIYPELSFISKVETERAMNNLNEIALFSEKLMLGRGDLIVNSSVYKLMQYEKNTREICDECGCELLFASGFLNSLQNNYLPSHSDVIDMLYAVNLNPEYIVLNTELVFSDRFCDAMSIINDLIETKI